MSIRSVLSPRRSIALLAGLIVAVSAYRAPRGDTPATPRLISAAGRSVPENVLSAQVVFSTQLGDSVRVTLWSGDSMIRATPYRLSRSAIDTIVVLGLLPSARYTYRVEAARNAKVRASDDGTFTTNRLPRVLAAPQMERLSGGNPTRMAVAVIPVDHGGWYGVVFDSTGTITWYHDFTRYGNTVMNLVKQPNGNFTAYIGKSFGWQATEGYFVEITPGGRKVAEYHAPPGYYMDPHELLLTGDGAAKRAHFFTYTIRPTNLTPIGGKAAVQTAGHQIVRTTPSGTVEFMWDAWDHIGLGEWIGDKTDKATRTATDYDHPNALTFDDHGNYVVSWRNLNQIMAVDPQNGSVLWRVGGVKSDYRFVGDPLGGFSKQHAIKFLPNGNLLLFDNGTEHSPSESRAAEYQLDRTARTATLVWQYRHGPPLYSSFVGWVQRLKNGNTWVAYALLGRVVEADSTGNALWEGHVRTPAGNYQTYRITPIRSLR